MEKINISTFIIQKKQALVIDVRSPGEYQHAHIPGAINLPLFSDEERKIVGTTYKQQSRQKAIKLGLDYFGVKMRKMVEEIEALLIKFQKDAIANGKQVEDNPQIYVHCWRGGMRSAAVAWLLNLYGFKVCALTRGYKAYREWVRMQFEQPYKLCILGGFTGSGKTQVIEQIRQYSHRVIDLEALANHKGSAFGAMNMPPQPSQEYFENLLATALYQTHQNAIHPPSVQTQAIWIEDESQRIGNLQIPIPLWTNMRKSNVIFLDIPFDKRLDYLVNCYGKWEKEKLINAIIRIQKRLGGLETKNAINFLIEDNIKACFSILLKYYDKQYANGVKKRDESLSLITKLNFDNINAELMAPEILKCQALY